MRTPRRDRGLIEGVLRNLPAFCELTPAQTQSLASHCWVLAAARGEPIVRAGARVPGLLAIAYGTVKLALRNGNANERVFALLAARHTFGEAAALLGRAVPYEAVAMSETKLVVIPIAPVLALIAQEPRFASGWLRSLAENEYALCAEIGAATLQTAAERLAAYLGELAGQPDESGGCVVELPVTKTLLAARLGMKKETLSRLLRRFAARGAIALTHPRTVVIDRERLSATARGANDALDEGQTRNTAAS